MRGLDIELWTMRIAAASIAHQMLWNSSVKATVTRTAAVFVLLALVAKGAQRL